MRPIEHIAPDVSALKWQKERNNDPYERILTCTVPDKPREGCVEEVRRCWVASRQTSFLASRGATSWWNLHPAHWSHIIWQRIPQEWKHVPDLDLMTTTSAVHRSLQEIHSKQTMASSFLAKERRGGITPSEGVESGHGQGFRDAHLVDDFMRCYVSKEIQ